MKRLLTIIATISIGISCVSATTAIDSPTEGVITHDFVSEEKMKTDLLQMLVDFSAYMKADFRECDTPNMYGEQCGCFMGENSMASDERGVRPNADLSMVCAFLVKYGKGQVSLPEGVTWDNLESMARRSLVFAYSTHKANRLKTCKGGDYWGSVSKDDHVRESSLWAMSVAYSAFFQWESLSQSQQDCIEAMLVAECNYELERDVPTGFNGDTKAEENGWEADVLAAALGLFPDHRLAPKWFERLREFAINSYSHPSDASDNTVVDPGYDGTTVAQLYKGANLYDDYTLQNHDLFHTSYQNVVMQELGEAALAMKLFQTGLHGHEKWHTNALMHNNREVMDRVLNWLALADGELAMPNGNDWSLFLFDQITSYSTMACFLADPDALMLENMAYKYVKARQQTTPDGSWLLNADVGARRMGVQAHRVMMTWLMHHLMPTSAVEPTAWADFNRRYAEARMLPSQNIVRASTPHRFSCFSWSDGLKSYTGYFTPNTPDNNKIIVPFRANNTGNILGWYEVEGRRTNAIPVASGNYMFDGTAYTMNGELLTNDSTLSNRFAIYSTPGNALIYLDLVQAVKPSSITRELGGLLAISTDPFTKERRVLHYGDSNHKVSDGKAFIELGSSWVNIDNSIGVVAPGRDVMAFGDRSLSNSIETSKFYPLYSAERRRFNAGDVVDMRQLVYYSDTDAPTTRAMAQAIQPLSGKIARGWNGIIVPDPDGTLYMLLSNFGGADTCRVSDISCPGGAPVFTVPTTISSGSASACFKADANHSVADVLKVFIKVLDKDARVIAVKSPSDPGSITLTNPGTSPVSVNMTTALTGTSTITIPPSATYSCLLNTP